VDDRLDQRHGQDLLDRERPVRQNWRRRSMPVGSAGGPAQLTSVLLLLFVVNPGWRAEGRRWSP
jgi:hypothetical protein